MTSYILLERLNVEDANCLAGITYGFPAVTHFLGFTHAVSRKLQAKHGIALQGCAIFCHDFQLHINEQFDVRFIQSKRPPVGLQGAKYKADAGKVPPIIEEGKMDMTVSLLLQCDRALSSREDIKEQYQADLLQWVYSSRLAGGTIHEIGNIHIFSEKDLRKIKHCVLPSFVLHDASSELESHITTAGNEQADRELFDLWTDFFAFKERAVADEVGKVTWVRQDRPKTQGWFVPLMIGYKGISPLYDGTEVKNSRDPRYPFQFVESVHSIGEWRSSHRISNLDSLTWKYRVKDEWYLCRQDTDSTLKKDSDQIPQEPADASLNEAFNSIF